MPMKRSVTVFTCATRSTTGYDRRRVRLKDEPFRGLRVWLIVEKRRLLCKPCGKVFTEPLEWARKGFRHTRIIATHDMDLVADACERSIVLHQGRVVADGPSREIFRDEVLLAGCRLEKPLSLQGCPVCRVSLTLLPSDRA